MLKVLGNQAAADVQKEVFTSKLQSRFVFLKLVSFYVLRSACYKKYIFLHRNFFTTDLKLTTLIYLL